jgi:hypothetical protein
MTLLLFLRFPEMVRFHQRQKLPLPAYSGVVCQRSLKKRQGAMQIYYTIKKPDLSRPSFAL